MSVCNELWQPSILALVTPIILVYGFLALLLCLILARGLYLWYAPPRPTHTKRFPEGTVEVYSLPLWRAQYIKADALIALTNESAFLGTTATKFIRDKADFRLDDAIRKHAPLPPGECLVMPLTRLPARRLAVTNITDEKGVITSRSLADAIQKTASALSKERIPSPGAVLLMKLPGFGPLAHRFPQKPIRSVLLCDPTSDWNYFERRVDGEESAQFLLQALLPHLSAFRTLKILITDPETALAYGKLLQNEKQKEEHPSARLQEQGSVGANR